MEFIGYLLLYKRVIGTENLNQAYSDISTYISHLDKLYIFDFSNQDQSTFFNSLIKYQAKIEFATLKTNGEAVDFRTCLEHAKKQNARYATILKLGYYFEDNGYLALKRFALENAEKMKTCAIMTPYPLYTCEETSQTKEEYRLIKGSHLIGTLINIDIYNQTSGINTIYYQTTFDYDYCLMTRKMGYKIVLMNNIILKNRNYKRISKRIFGHMVYSYATDIYDLYYETRNRLYLWDQYIDFDPEYVKADKLQQKNEFKEIRLIEKGYKEKKEIIKQATEDYNLHKMGKAFEEIKY